MIVKFYKQFGLLVSNYTYFSQEFIVKVYFSIEYLKSYISKMKSEYKISVQNGFTGLLAEISREAVFTNIRRESFKSIIYIPNI